MIRTIILCIILLVAAYLAEVIGVFVGFELWREPYSEWRLAAPKPNSVAHVIIFPALLLFSWLASVCVYCYLKFVFRSTSLATHLAILTVALTLPTAIELLLLWQSENRSYTSQWGPWGKYKSYENGLPTIATLKMKGVSILVMFVITGAMISLTHHRRK